ncbi:hypothetical protein [Teredinibacter purpureus]|uniref:hypothetical protein n=1 Tax=Teredinibacter purpureus TaxID=2731756 RepID=UPI0006960083|nr:hypothetical protein [Teredinibacter purpureus]
MNPWLLLSWAPTIHFPLSGDVEQDLHPNNHQFFQAIQKHAGDKVIEEKVFNIATYGHQLALLTDLVTELAASQNNLSPKAAKALASIQDIKQQIEHCKKTEYQTRTETLQAELAELTHKIRTPPLQREPSEKRHTPAHRKG